MNHPEREEYVPYLSGEASPEQRQRLRAHLANCADCREEIEDWQRSLGRLSQWKLPAPRPRFEAFLPMFRWATVAALLAGVAFFIGRFTGSAMNAKAIQAAVQPALQQQALENRQQISAALAALAETLEKRRAEDNKAILAMFEKLEAQHTADVLALKKDLDTVALNTDASLRQAELQLVQLADSKQPMNQQ